MLLNSIRREFGDLKSIFEESDLNLKQDIFTIFLYKDEDFTIEKMLLLVVQTRHLSMIKGMILSRHFQSACVKEYINSFLDSVDLLISAYDKLFNEIINKNTNICDYIDDLKTQSLLTRDWMDRIEVGADILENIENEMWEPLPKDVNTNVEDVIISSDSKLLSLNNVAEDVNNINNFFNNMITLLGDEKDRDFFLRKVETGSLMIVVSIVGASEIISFIFLIVKLYQKTEKRYLKNTEKKLELVNKSINMAKELLKINPNNTEANEIIQKCGLYILEFLDNNPKGTINGTKYDIGEELKLEQKEVIQDEDDSN